MKRIEADWTAYYSLGFESPAAKPGSPRSLKVTVARKGAEVRTRRTVIERTPEQKVADAVLAGAYIPHTSNPLGASLNIGAAKRSGSKYLLPLEFRIPFEKLTLVPEGGRARGAVVFTEVVASPEGRVSKVTTQRAPLDIPESELASLAGKSFTYSATLEVRAGSLTVLDRADGRGLTPHELRPASRPHRRQAAHAVTKGPAPATRESSIVARFPASLMSSSSTPADVAARPTISNR